MYEDKPQMVGRGFPAPDFRNCVAGEPMRDTPEVERSLNDLREVVQRYDQLVGRLGDRLNNVVCPVGPTADSGRKEIGYQTVLASQINEVRCRLRDITDGLESLYQRIEL